MIPCPVCGSPQIPYCATCKRDLDILRYEVNNRMKKVVLV